MVRDRVSSHFLERGPRPALDHPLTRAFDAATHLAQGVSRLAGSASGGRDVVTNEDVLAAAQAGLSVLEVASGSIVTALARETANRNGIEVRFR